MSNKPKRQRCLCVWVDKFDRYLESMNYSAMTRRQYKHRLLAFSTWVTDKYKPATIQAVSAEIIGDYQVYLVDEHRRPLGGKIALGTQMQRLAPLKTFFKWLCNRGAVPSDPAVELVLPVKAKTLPRDVPSVREISCVLRRVLRQDKNRLRDAAIIGTLFASGCRKMELARLRLCDVDLKAREVRIEKAKNRQGRLTFISPWAAELLRAYIERERPKLPKDAPLFISERDGGQMEDSVVGKVVSRPFRSIRSKRVCCHSLRHAFCLSLLRGGASIRVIAELAGHKRLSCSAIYTRLELADLRKVHERAFVE